MGTYLGSMRMSRKLFLAFVLLIALPLSFVGYITYTNYSSSVEEQTKAYSETMQENMMNRIDEYIDDMVRLSSVPSYQDEIKANLIRSNRYYEQRMKIGADERENFDLLLSIQRGIEDNIAFINTIKKGAHSVYIFDRYGNGYYATSGGSVRQDLKMSYREWTESVADSSGEARLLGTQKYTSSLQSEKYAFTVVRKIIDKSLNPVGLIAVDAGIDVIEEGVRELDNVTKGSSILIDGDGSVIYDSHKPERIATNIDGDEAVVRAAGVKGSFYLETEGVGKLYIYTTSPNTGWKVMTGIPVDELTRDARVTRNVTFVATLVALLVAMIISVIMSYALANPLRRMMKLMKSVQEGDFSVQFQVKNRDEVGQLGTHFNRMIVRIDQLIRDIYEIEAKKQEAELQALQNQINPHFMYNTLESIRMTAELNDDADAADMIAILGKLLRYGISDPHEQVTLRDEIDHVKNYVELLNYRYPDRFRLEVDIPESEAGRLMRLPVTKLILQPIVENAIYHGMDESKPAMHIRIGAERSGGTVAVRIRDDGTGMDAETLDKLNQSLSGVLPAAEQPSRVGGIGLRNVNERIKLHYGSAYGLKASSEQGSGTEIELLLPEWKGDGER